MKRLLCLLTIVVFIISGCKKTPNIEPGKINIITTIFPAYDWVVNIIGENKDDYNVVLLTDNGVDLHNYTPSADDIISIQKCDIFIYVGGESDEWAKDISGVKRRISLMDIAQKAKLAVIEDGEEDEYDEHVWLSLNIAKLACYEIRETLKKLDPKGADDYSANYSTYLSSMARIDKEFRSSKASGTMIFADRFPFRYLAEDYKLSYAAAFNGCSAETEASFDVIASLASQIDKVKPKSIFIIDDSTEELAETVISASTRHPKIVRLDSMQGVTKENIQDGKSYLNVMQDNLRIIAEALTNDSPVR